MSDTRPPGRCTRIRWCVARNDLDLQEAFKGRWRGRDPDYSQKLQESDLPKFLLWANPGVAIVFEAIVPGTLEPHSIPKRFIFL